MNNEQVERWKLVTKAYCYGARPEATQERKDRLWSEAEEFIDHHKDEPVDGWDNQYCLCDHYAEWFSEHEEAIYVEPSPWNGYYKENPRYFTNHLRAAIRAGVNAAVGEGFGVIGFTIGELKQMLGGEIPDWYACQYDMCLASANDDEYIVL